MGTRWGAHSGEQLGSLGFSCIQHGHPHSECLCPNSQSLTGGSQQVPRLVLCPLGFLMAQHAQDFHQHVPELLGPAQAHLVRIPQPLPARGIPPVSRLVLWVSPVPADSRACHSARQGQCWATGTPLLCCGVRAPLQSVPSRAVPVQLSLPGDEQGTCALETGMCRVSRLALHPAQGR